MKCEACQDRQWWMEGATLFVCSVCSPPSATDDIPTRLALLEGQARDSAAAIDEMRCQLIDVQRRLQALEDREAMIGRAVDAFCLPVPEFQE